MLKVEDTQVLGWEAAIRGMRNPMQSWGKSDTLFIEHQFCDDMTDRNLAEVCGGVAPVIKKNDLVLMRKLSKAGPEHAKYLRMIQVTADVTAPDYWWKEYATYKIGTTENSTSTMHRLTAKEFCLSDFSVDQLTAGSLYWMDNTIIPHLNACRDMYQQTKDKLWWYQLVQLLPMSYNYRRTICLNYQVLSSMYHHRKNHKLDEWHAFCDWIESLPYSEIITGEEANHAD